MQRFGSISTTTFILALCTVPSTAAAQNLIFEKSGERSAPGSISFEPLNTRESALLIGCRSLAGSAAQSGFYWIQFEQSRYSIMFCDNEVEYDGLKGGWTLVWSNLRGGRGKLTSDLHWGASIESLPRYRGTVVSTSSPDRQSFEVYTGLRFWHNIINAQNARREIMYEWASNYSDTRQIDMRAACDFNLSSTDWVISFTQPCRSLAGSVIPGFFTYHNGMRWSTVDNDRDNYNDNCAAMYTGSPWWYGSCWSGSISGGGEDSGGNYLNGAHWAGSAVGWGRVDGTGAGNGWIYVR